MTGLFCGNCQREYSLDEPLWRCECGSVLDIECEANFPLPEITGRPPTLWRYRESIPLAVEENIISVSESQILESLRMMGRIGHYIESTSAVAIAGAKTYLKGTSSGETTVVPLTGTGLKAMRKMMDLEGN